MFAMSSSVGYSMAVVFLFTTAFACVSGSTMKCYNCNSTALPDACGKEFKLQPSNISHVTDGCESCSKHVHHVDSETVYIRGCFRTTSNAVSFRSGCSSSKDHGYKMKECFCNKDLCNNSMSGTANLLAIVLLVTAGKALFFPV